MVRDCPGARGASHAFNFSANNLSRLRETTSLSAPLALSTYRHSLPLCRFKRFIIQRDLTTRCPRGEPTEAAKWAFSRSYLPAAACTRRYAALSSLSFHPLKLFNVLIHFLSFFSLSLSLSLFLHHTRTHTRRIFRQRVYYFFLPSSLFVRFISARGFSDSLPHAPTRAPAHTDTRIRLCLSLFTVYSSSSCVFVPRKGFARIFQGFLPFFHEL